MQDKEFDKVFNSKFEDFEVEPSAMVWDNIADELDGKKGNRSLMPYLSIAASVVILLTAGILFLQKGKITKQQVDLDKLTANHVEPVTTDPPQSNTEATIITQPDHIAASVNYHATTNTSQVNSNTIEPVITKTEQVINQPEPVKTDNQPMLAAMDTHAVQNVVPGKEVQFVPKALDLEQQAAIEKPLMASANKTVTAPVKRRGIHSLGGLVNALVATVDKRQDKLIEFSDGDDDDTESSLTGVNLGLIKIKAVTK